MPTYWGDYARDTGHFGAVHHGAYLMLIKHYWCTGQPLPDDDTQLWRIATCDSIQHWRKIKPLIAPMFQIGDGAWKHKRIEAELKWASMLTEQRRAAGKASAEQRKRNERSTGVDNPSGDPLQRNGRPSQSQSHSDPKGSGAGAPDVASVVFGIGLAWLRKSTGKSEDSCRTMLGKWRRQHGDEALISVLGAAQREGPIEAVAWIERAFQARSQPPPKQGFNL